MVFEIKADSAPKALQELLIRMPMEARANESRNGMVYTVPGLSILEITDPTKRVIFNPIRDANPFFHVMEAIWMFAGADNVEWPVKFVHRYENYAEDNGIVHGAYGWRWRNQFGEDQIMTAIKMLKRNPLDRRVVVTMWDTELDLGVDKRDLPCNTHIYFRADSGMLDMTVCNRSNDALWGMLGANVVHMTMLHELISVATMIPLGTYRVVTNNLHVYPALVRDFAKLWGNGQAHDSYEPDHWDAPYVTPNQLLLNGEEPSGFLRACEHFIENPHVNRDYYFLDTVAKPMYMAWEERSRELCDDIRATDWKLACKEWLERRSN